MYIYIVYNLLSISANKAQSDLGRLFLKFIKILSVNVLGNYFCNSSFHNASFFE